MSLKITNTEGFTIGNVLNPSITEIYVRANVDMNKQQSILNDQQDVEFISIKTNAKSTLLGGLFDTSISVDGISPIYWLKYSVDFTDMNQQYLEIETDLKTMLEVGNPLWTIEIIEISI
jgi:hypothetical protein